MEKPSYCPKQNQSKLTARDKDRFYLIIKKDREDKKMPTFSIEAYIKC